MIDSPEAAGVKFFHETKERLKTFLCHQKLHGVNVGYKTQSSFSNAENIDATFWSRKLPKRHVAFGAEDN
jgi:hypothetical protein